MVMEYYIVAAIAVALSLLATPLIRKVSLANNIVDQPGGRRVNKQPIPRMGGVAIVLAFWLTILGIVIIAPEKLQFTNSTILGIDRNLFGVFLGSLILVTTGIIDDIRGLSPATKLVAQILAAVCIPLFGIHIQWLANPLGGADLQLPFWLDTALIVGWIVGMINVVNWLDGLDGLAAGVSSIASLIIFSLSLAVFVNQPATALLAIILFGATLGFLPYNLNPAKIFMGDSGSMFLGYMLAILAVISGGKLATAGLVLGIPILDAAWVIVSRLLSGQSPWKADRRHLHHRLLDAGLSQRQSVFLYWIFSATFGAIALASRTYGKVNAAIAMIGLMAVIGLILYVTGRRKRI
jgi:UDP-GlcNAc:undecaprenyl-phosphate GlcNAc-1-phosphate transferase